MKLIARALYNTGDRMKLEKCETREIRNVMICIHNRWSLENDSNIPRIWYIIINSISYIKHIIL